MKRNITALVLFILLVMVSAGQLWLLGRTTEQLDELIDEYEQSVILDRNDSGERLSELSAYWEKYYRTASFLTRSDSLSDMAADVSRLRSMKDKEALLEELHSLRKRAELILDEQIPHPESVF
ncbi:MAG: DUF4363 family protein [Ruminococcus sp.]|nr:DUF4363 family protein [Ruminococcus sp.]